MKSHLLQLVFSDFDVLLSVTDWKTVELLSAIFLVSGRSTPREKLVFVSVAGEGPYEVQILGQKKTSVACFCDLFFMIAELVERFCREPISPVCAVHAASVMSPKGLVIFMGKSGAGKSTLAYECSRFLGWNFLGDEYGYFDSATGLYCQEPFPGVLKLAKINTDPWPNVLTPCAGQVKYGIMPVSNLQRTIRWRRPILCVFPARVSGMSDYVKSVRLDAKGAIGSLLASVCGPMSRSEMLKGLLRGLKDCCLVNLRYESSVSAAAAIRQILLH